ncbi:MAG: aspartate/tyrosine/aromatic aminotransferase [Steroidobacteraceae bacterium]|nr:aspartate/tyrosine/aromatic aminotransferase [Steroidobacteraceae bacterium]
MFGNLETLPPDPILGVTAAFRRDPDPGKVDLGVGVYRDADGNTPVPRAVREAERALLAEQRTKVYVGPAGNLEFNERIVALALGPLANELRERTATIQTVGGCGALRMGAELLHVAAPDSIVHVSDPTWANHEPLLGNSGIALQRYPYYEQATRGIAFDRLLGHLERLPAGAVVLLHGCCHNPTGVDLGVDQWQAIADVLERRGLVPFVDLAYQGFGDDLESDVAGLRLLARRLPTLLLAISCSKNFGLYRERAGAFAIVAENAATARAIATHQARTGRRMYSMPPDHGAAIAARVLGDATLRQDWADEVAAMVARMKFLRALLAGRLSARRPDIDFSWLTQQRGMFSLLGLAPAAIAALCNEEHVYMPPDGRINLAGVSDANVDRVADSIVRVLDRN